MEPEVQIELPNIPQWKIWNTNDGIGTLTKYQ